MTEDQFDKILDSKGFSEEKRHLIFLSVSFSALRKLLVKSGMITNEELAEVLGEERKNIIEAILPKYKDGPIISPFGNP